MTLDFRSLGHSFFGSNTGHEQAQSFRGGVLTRDNVHDLTFVDYRDAIGKGQDLIEAFRDKYDRRVLTSLFKQLFTDIFRRSDIEAACRLCGDDHARVSGNLAGEDHLLNVSA